MGKAKLISKNDDDSERIYKLIDGTKIKFILVESSGDYEIKFQDLKGNNLFGGFIFRYDEDSDSGNLLLARMYSPSTQNGIGRECLNYIQEKTGADIYTRPHDGDNNIGDGSHLTGDAPIFVTKMQKEGLILEDGDFDEDDFDEDDFN